MYEFLSTNSLYVVLSVALTVWLGIAWYLFRLERSVARLTARFSADAELTLTKDSGSNPASGGTSDGASDGTFHGTEK